MKKILIALVVMVGFAGTAMSQTKVGHVQSSVLYDTLEMSKTAATQYYEAEKALSIELQELEQGVAKAEEELNKIKGTPGASQTLISIKERNLNTKYGEYQKRGQSMQYELQLIKNELESPIFELIFKATSIVAEREKYDYILNESQVLFAGEDSDVTDLVLTELIRLEKEKMAEMEAAANGGGTTAGGGTPGAQ